MRPETCLLVDVGSTGCRAELIDTAGRGPGRAARDLDVREHGDRVEYDAGVLVEAVETVIEEAVGENAVDAVGLAVQRGSVVCWDRPSGRALSPVISWRDRRTAGSDPPMAHGRIKRLTGLRFSPYAGAPKLAWCHEHLPAVRGADTTGRLAAGPLGSFLAARLTREPVALVDATLAQRTLLLGCRTGRWEPRLLEAFGLPENALPQVIEADAGFGRVKRLPGQPPLAMLAGDQNVLPFIDGEPDPDTLYINLGTGAFLLRPVSSFVDTREFQLSMLGNGGWALEGSVHGAASALAWLGERFDREADPGALASLSGIENPPLFINTLGGLGSPWWQPGPEARFVGHSTPGADFEARLLGVIESIAFLLRANFDAMNRLVGPPERIVVAGGLSRAQALVERIAALLGTDVHRLEEAEGTTLGLWCRLRGAGLDSGAFRRLPGGDRAALEARYRHWLGLMPPVGP